MRQIPLADFIADWEKGYIKEVVFVGSTINRVYGKTLKGTAQLPERYEVVWSSVP